MAFREISPVEAKEWLASKCPPRLIDVREPEEWDVCRIEGAELIPLSQFTALAARSLTDPDEALLVYCHHGVRSARVTQYLLRQGFTEVVNLGGGIDAWACEVDPAVRRY
jgi:rhodanese-related sulfurtransferase